MTDLAGASGPDWPRPVVHWEIRGRDPERLAAFYAALFNWEVSEGPVMTVPPGAGGPEPGPGGHIARGDGPGVVLYIQVRDLGASLAKAVALGARVLREPFEVSGGPTIARIADPEGNTVALVQQ